MDNIVLKAFIPEIFFSFCILFQLLFNVFVVKRKGLRFPVLNKEVFFQSIFIFSILLILYLNLRIEGVFSNYLFVANSGITLLKITFILISLFGFVVIWRGFVVEALAFSEFFSLYFLAILALLLLLNAYDLITMYILLEMQALCFYLLANFKRTSSFSTEAGLKYFISGSVISGLFLFGCSLLYGMFGTLNCYVLTILLSFPLEEGFFFFQILLLISVVLILTIFLFKLAVVPFHFWSPDVYEGSPLSSTIIFSIVPKVVLFTLLLRWISVVYPIILSIKFLFLLLGVSSIIIGIFFASRQKRLKRFIIYSSISQVGFIVLSLYHLHVDSYAIIFFYLFVYMITSIVLWNLISLLYSFQINVSKFYKKEVRSFFISNLSNYSSINKPWSYAFLILFASLAGIPPFSGFLPKILVMFTLAEAGIWGFNVFLMLLTCLIIWYYINVLTIIFMEVRDKYNTLAPLYTSTFFVKKNNLDNLDYFCIALGLFLLLLLFYLPSYLLLVCQYIVFYIF